MHSVKIFSENGNTRLSVDGIPMEQKCLRFRLEQDGCNGPVLTLSMICDEVEVVADAEVSQKAFRPMGQAAKVPDEVIRKAVKEGLSGGSALSVSDLRAALENSGIYVDPKRVGQLVDKYHANQTEKGDVTVHVNVDTSELDAAIEKANRLHDIIKEANSLARELASEPVNVTIAAH